MHKMRTFAIDVSGSLSVCTSHGFMRPHSANTAERIEVLLVVETLRDLGNTVLDVVPYFSHGLDAALDNCCGHMFAVVLYGLSVARWPSG